MLWSNDRAVVSRGSVSSLTEQNEGGITVRMVEWRWSCKLLSKNFEQKRSRLYCHFLCNLFQCKLSELFESAAIHSTPLALFFAVLDISFEQIYRLFLEKKHVPLTAAEVNDQVSKHSIRLEKSHRVSIQILNRSVFTKDRLYRLGIVDSPNCASCHDEAESIEHLLGFCTKSAEFWKHVLATEQ